jgi:hypothetical protein
MLKVAMACRLSETSFNNPMIPAMRTIWPTASFYVSMLRSSTACDMPSLLGWGSQDVPSEYAR